MAKRWTVAMAVLLLLGIPALASALLSTRELRQMRCLALSAMGEVVDPLIPSALSGRFLTSLESHFGNGEGSLLSCRPQSRCPLVSVRHRGRLVWIL
jgi:hypothetical protein